MPKSHIQRREYMLLHADLFVRSAPVAIDFYCGRLGFSVAEDAILRGAMVRSLSNGCYEAMRVLLLKLSPVGAMIELMELQSDSALISPPTSLPIHAGWVTFFVSDLSAHIDFTIARGLHPSSEVFTIDLPRAGRFNAVYYRDPDGNGLEFLCRC